MKRWTRLCLGFGMSIVLAAASPARAGGDDRDAFNAVAAELGAAGVEEFYFPPVFGPTEFAVWDRIATLSYVRTTEHLFGWFERYDIGVIADGSAANAEEQILMLAEEEAARCGDPKTIPAVDYGFYQEPDDYAVMQYCNDVLIDRLPESSEPLPHRYTILRAISKDGVLVLASYTWGSDTDRAPITTDDLYNVHPQIGQLEYFTW